MGSKVPERQVLLLGRRGGVAGDSSVWEARHRGRLVRVDRDWMRRGLHAGWLTGVESVRREDGDWGPLFGRPVYREVFGGKVEPRDHAKARAAARISRFSRVWHALAIAAVVALGVSVFVPVVVQLGLLAAAALGIGAGWMRLRTAMAQHELVSLVDQLVPPVTEPPPIPPDWALQAAEDEVEAYLRDEPSPES